MSNLAFISVALRLVGIWLLLTRGFPFLNGIFLAADRGLSISDLSKFYGLLMPSLVIGAIMVIWPLALARFLTPRRIRDEGPTGWTVEQFQLSAFGLIGLFLVATALASQTTWSIALAAFTDFEPNAFVFNYAAVIGVVVRALIGTWLLFKAKRLVQLLRITWRTGSAKGRGTQER